MFVFSVTVWFSDGATLSQPYISWPRFLSGRVEIWRAGFGLILFSCALALSLAKGSPGTVFICQWILGT